MEGVLNATDVRRDWGKFIDTIVHDKPKIVKRNRDLFLSLSIQQVMVLLKNFSFKAQYLKENDGTVTATLDNFDLVVNEKDEFSAKKALAQELIDYAKDYFNDFQLYFNAPNRQPHFPYILLVLMQEDLDGVINLISA
ncbi:MAG: hypothetical protein ACYC0Q_00500 [Eubacteriales bacterium]